MLQRAPLSGVVVSPSTVVVETVVVVGDGVVDCGVVVGGGLGPFPVIVADLVNQKVENS